MSKYKKYYIDLLLGTFSKEEYKKELERLKYIVGVSPKPLRTEKETRFIEYVDEHCYKRNQAFVLLQKKFKFQTDSQEIDVWMKHTGLSEPALRAEVSKYSKKATKLINAAFKAHKKELKKLLK